MNNNESLNSREILKNPELIETKSTQIERLENLFTQIDKNDVESEVSKLNKIFSSELERVKQIDFNLALNRVKNPVGVS